MTDVYLLLGSNLGNKLEYLNKAAQLINERVGAIEASSSIYETAPWGVSNEQDLYVNQVLKVNSLLNAHQVLEKILIIEKELGRIRIEKWGSRVIDIDILFYGNEIINEPDLIIPHKYFHERRFAVEPMMEINNTFKHPLLKKSIKSIALELTDGLSVKRLNLK